MNWLKILNSPFKPFKLKWYFGKTAIGVPFFFPRKWVYYTKKEAIELANEKKYPDNLSVESKAKMFENSVESYRKTQYPKPRKFGFNYCGLGWKTKWGDTNYRHEYNPVFSFVFFGYQIALTIIEPDHTYWETWLYYERNTDKNKTELERLLQCIENRPNVWVRHSGDKKIRTNHYKFILKAKYLKYVK